MKTGTFMDIVGTNYDDIRRIYCSRDNNAGRKFSEDAFNEAFIKCALKFGNSVITYDDVIKYFWIAYLNTHKKDMINNSKLEYVEEYPEMEEEDESFSKKFYNTIMTEISKAFSEDDMMIYSLHKYHGWKKEDLENADYDCKDFELRIKNIHRFVKEYSKKNFKSNFKKR